jgi:hypothetical protein
MINPPGMLISSIIRIIPAINHKMGTWASIKEKTIGMTL